VRDEKYKKKSEAKSRLQNVRYVWERDITMDPKEVYSGGTDGLDSLRIGFIAG
jgi:hypothetical protein